MRDALARRGLTDISLQPGRSGQFDVLIDGELRYSRDRTGAFPSDAELDALL